MKSIHDSKTLSTEAAAGDLEKLIDQLQKDPLPVILNNENGNRAVLISTEDYNLLRDTLDTMDDMDENLAEPRRIGSPDQPLISSPESVSDDYSEVFQFNISLQDVEPKIWRRIQVPVNYTFWDLHVAIQDAMGWEDVHMHVFEIIHPDSGRTETCGTPFDDSGGSSRTRPDWEVTLAECFTTAETEVRYTYDFGDNWVHHVKMEDINPRDSAVEYPICLDGRRACPPEDCGGIPGYQYLLEVVDSPEDGEHEDWSEWIGEGFDPEYFSPAEVLFDDPEERWEDIFNTDEEDEEDEEDNWYDDDPHMLMRRLNREHMHQLWQSVQDGQIADLSPEDQSIARIMQAHEDTFYNQFSVADLTADHDFDPDTEVDPFLHVTLHAIVEKQIEDRDPIEAFQFYNSMRNKKCSRHDALHLLGLILTPFIFRALKYREPFDLSLYRDLLKKYKNRKPDKIPDLLDGDPAFDV